MRHAVLTIAFCLLLGACVSPRPEPAVTGEPTAEPTSTPTAGGGEPVSEPQAEPSPSAADEAQALREALAEWDLVTDDDVRISLDEWAGEIRVSPGTVSIISTEDGVFDDGVDRTVALWAAETCYHIVETLEWDRTVYIDDASGSELATARDGRCEITQP